MKELADNDEIFDTVNGIVEEDKTVKDSRKDSPEKKLEKAFFTYMGEGDPKFLKAEFPDNKWNHLTQKLAYPYEYFNSIDVCQKPVDKLKKKDFLTKLKNKFPDDEQKNEQKELFNYSVLKMEKN